MKRIGICQKCGQEKIVRDHHINGYLGEHKDEVIPYCASCDFEAHATARREEKCTLSTLETRRLSTNSSNKRSMKHFSLSCETIIPNVQLREKLDFNINTGQINICSYFVGSHSKKLKFIYEI